jgi:hypothetical protein
MNSTPDDYLRSYREELNKYGNVCIACSDPIAVGHISGPDDSGWNSALRALGNLKVVGFSTREEYIRRQLEYGETPETINDFPAGQGHYRLTIPEFEPTTDAEFLHSMRISGDLEEAAPADQPRVEIRLRDAGEERPED